MSFEDERKQIWENWQVKDRQREVERTANLEGRLEAPALNIDNSSVIKPEHCKAVFELFEQADLGLPKSTAIPFDSHEMADRLSGLCEYTQAPNKRTLVVKLKPEQGGFLLRGARGSFYNLYFRHSEKIGKNIKKIYGHRPINI